MATDKGKNLVRKSRRENHKVVISSTRNQKVKGKKECPC
jgi:hypothetical protein